MTTELTADEPRKTGISVIGDVPWGTHFCYFYETKQDLLETLVLYFKAGLESQEFCVWVISPLLSVEEVKDALGQAVPDLHSHLAEGDLEIHSYQEWYLRDGRWDSQRVLQSWREKLNQGSGNGYAGFRAAGDGGWVQNDNWMAFCEYEEQVSAMLVDQRSVVLCTYPLTTSSGDQVFDVAHVHDTAVARRNGSWETVETSELKQAKAEIKRLNEALEQKVQERTSELAAANAALRAEIGERRLAEEAVKQAEDRVRLIIDTIPTMAWSLQPDGVVDFVNQRWVDYTGVSFQDAIREPNGIVHPDDLPMVLKNWLGDMAAGRPSEDEMRLRRGDGEYRWFLVRTVPLRDEHGNIIKWYGVSTDIEDRKRAEKKLLQSERQLAEAQRLAHIGSWDWDLRTNAVTWSEELYHIFGLQPGTISVAGEVDRFIHPEDLALGWDTVKRAVASKEPYDYYHRILRPDGTERIARSRGSIISDERGEPIRVFGATQDVTELKRAEEKLKEAGEQLRALIDAIPHQIWSGPADGTMDYCNERWRSYMGLEQEDLRGDGWQRMLHPDDWERVLKAWHDSVETGTPYEQEERHRGADGTYRWFLARGVPMRDTEGRIVRWYGTNTDIEERKQAEEALDERLHFETLLTELSAAFANLATNEVDREIEKWLQTLAEFLAVDRASFFQFEEDWTTLYLSHSYSVPGIEPLPPRPIGMKEQFPWIMDQLRRGVTVKWSRIPDDMPEEAVKEKAYAAKVGAKSGLNIPVTMGGSVICAITFTSMASYRDWPEAMIARLRLVGQIFATAIERKRAEAALRKSEERYRNIFENAGEGIFQSTPDGRYIAANPALARMYRFASPEELIRSLQDISRQVYVDPRRREEFKRQIEEQGAVRGFEHEVFRQDGSRLWISLNARAVRDEQGAILYYEGTAQDIGERKRAVEELEAANHQLRILSRRLFQVQEDERRHLARELHDEIGQALTAAKINLDSIELADGQTQAPRLKETITLLDNLLRQVRQISLDLRPSLLDDLGLVPALRSLLDHQARRTGLRMQFSAPEPLQPVDLGLQTTAFRIAQEAITNVLRHAAAQSVGVNLSVEADQLRMRIVDDGKGFDLTDVERRPQPDAGFGLIGMKERAALVGGGLHVISSPGKGTAIEVSLPLTFHPNDASG